MGFIENMGTYYAAWSKSMVPITANPLTTPIEEVKWKGIFNAHVHKWIGALVLLYHLWNKQLGLFHLLMYFLPVYWLMKWHYTEHEYLKGFGIFCLVCINGGVMWLI